MEDKSLQVYCNINPNHLSCEQIEQIKDEFAHPQDGLISDELLDYKLWRRDAKSRQEQFAQFVLDTLHPPVSSRILEVGGKNGRVSYILAQKGYRMTCIDPQLNVQECWKNGVVELKKMFDYRDANLEQYDYVIAQEPCEATEHVVRACAKYQVSYLMDLCGVPHLLISGEQPNNSAEWYDYLHHIDQEHTVIGKHTLFPLAYCYYIRGEY